MVGLVKKLKSKLLRLKYTTFVGFLKNDAQQCLALPPTEREAFLAQKIANAQPWDDCPSHIGLILDFTVAKDIAYKPNEDIVGVIVETREHPLLNKVIKGYLKQCQTQVCVFCSHNNLDFVMAMDVLQQYPDDVKIFVIPENITSAKGYNELLLSTSFWDVLPEVSHVMVFQTDGTFNPNVFKGLDKFLHFDYIGAWWNHRIRPNGMIVDGGTGGLCMRNRRLSIEAIKQYAHLGWSGGEDDFFAFYIELLGGNVAQKKDTDSFCLQYRYMPGSVSVHQPEAMSAGDLTKLLEEMPDAAELLPKK